MTTIPGAPAGRGRYRCPQCRREFTAPASGAPTCRSCGAVALTLCRRCRRPRAWASRRLQWCAACIDFVQFQGSGSITSTPTGRLSDRPSRARRLSSGQDGIPPARDPDGLLPILPAAPKPPRTSKYAKQMRTRPTRAEARLGQLLRSLLPRTGQVQQQWTFGGEGKRYILDFFIPEVRLGIEVDGPSHAQAHQRKVDAAKAAAAMDLDITLMRITNEECLRLSDAELTDWLRTAWREASQRRRGGRESRS